MAHSPEKKAAVMAALLAGQGVGEIAADYDIPESTIRYWKMNLPDEESTKIAAKRVENLGTLTDWQTDTGGVVSGPGVLGVG